MDQMKTIVILISLSVTVLSASVLAEKHMVESKKALKIAVAVYRPPYIFEKKNQGLDFDIASVVLEKKGYRSEFLHSPNQRALKEIEEGKVDGVIGVLPSKSKEVCYTKPLLYYDNVAISKSKSNIKIGKISDLKDHKILTFSKADEYLGEEFKQLVKSLKYDSDIANQRDQSRLFWSDKVPVIVTDLRIFRHYQKELAKDMKTDEEIVVHRIFPMDSNQRVAGFRDPQVCKDFDQALKEIKADGTYQKILDKYEVR